MENKPQRRGIFCIETVWYESEDMTSVRPMLEMLQKCFLKVPFIHRTAVTRGAFVHHLLEWLKCKAKSSKGELKYPILYLCYHGESEVLKFEGSYLPKDTDLTLAAICKILCESGYGDCKDSLVHFASCSTLNVKGAHIDSLVARTKASAISGYDRGIDWIDSAAFELNYLRRLQFGGGKSLTKNVMNNVKNGTKNWPKLMGKKGEGPFVDLGKELGFQLHVPK